MLREVSIYVDVDATSAATWLVTARKKFGECQDEGGVAHVTRLIETLRAQEE
jgi:hypothetical protein